MTIEVKQYHIAFYGGPKGFHHNRAQIALFGEDGQAKAFLRFNDPSDGVEPDSEEDGIIRMHFPTTLFPDVLDVLRNEQPVYIYFGQGRGFLSSAPEPAGIGAP
jgi:hypothetical protein